MPLPTGGRPSRGFLNESNIIIIIIIVPVDLQHTLYYVQIHIIYLAPDICISPPAKSFVTYHFRADKDSAQFFPPLRRLSIPNDLN